MSESDLMDALDAWETYWGEAQRAAVTVITTAFPALGEPTRYVGCHPLRLEFEEPGLGAGRVCFDEEGRVHVDFEGVPNGVIARAVDEVRFPSLEGADGPLCGAPPGGYVFENEVTGSEFEFVLGEGGLGRVVIAFASVPDAAAVLDALVRHSIPVVESAAGGV
ncbi:hypothetical protein AB0G74_08720 [Streptomyces sp. NPDC020875]|uniref:hypothetical protein n=1 Tax=Streptomyces sp. NPDC020875 TaxID=3154898 RepID=UPI0033FE36D0